MIHCQQTLLFLSCLPPFLNVHCCLDNETNSTKSAPSLRCPALYKGESECSSTLLSNNYIFLLMSVLQIRCVNKIFCIVLTSQPGIIFSCCFQTSCQKIRTSLLINKTANPGQKAQVMPPTITKIIPLPFVSGNISLGTCSVERRYLL